ncbi:hypothetical protein GHK92_08090 [Nocardioides sp. dk4132]|uniref:hypothetical protein n=1 Tax=unclassified Nocardioides TaxID=2615069 RepID=UPI0012978325|nr:MULTISPECIES: hypothetical protein [unclassified Nocardioides]MQW75831.1 hypothetical protein [Nocardioides sp. dk4132]QGA08701.1 hypothetical protein GFH29_15850 [Nocardioides sp. dk884]
MELYNVLVAEVLPVLMERLDETPEPEDVKAGWVGFGVFLALCVAVGLLGWALTRQLRRTEANRKKGAFGPYREPRPDSRIPGAEETTDTAAAPEDPSDDPQRPQG